MANFPVKSATANADNATATATLTAAGAGKRLDGLTLLASYKEKPAAAKTLTIKRGTTVLATQVITEAGLAPFSIAGLQTLPNEALSAELEASGAAGNVGYVTITAQII